MNEAQAAAEYNKMSWAERLVIQNEAIEEARRTGLMHPANNVPYLRMEEVAGIILRLIAQGVDRTPAQ